MAECDLLPRAFGNGIIFQFEDEVTMNKGQFRETHESGIWLGSNFDESTRKSRWGFVVSAGPDCRDPGICVGARILVENLKWTNGFMVGGEQYWKTDDDQILAVDADV